MNNLCSNEVPEFKDVKCCDYAPRFKAIVMPKKGMAEKAFKKYIEAGRIDLIQKQIERGTVLIRYQ